MISAQMNRQYIIRNSAMSEKTLKTGVETAHVGGIKSLETNT